ncbi:MAG: ferrous iron transport protein B [Planctomycetes bacterium]|nr:ferrous iron transport protein B [Planctomycetota bacterium]
MSSPVPRPFAPRERTRSGAPTVLVVGNPNAGKTTIFNRLTGLSQKVGNYPGVTVEKKEGERAIDGLTMRFVDLPGTYSLAAHSPDEMVAVDVLLGHQEGEPGPDLVLQIVDASNLERNLYLLSQVLELGVPVVVALNMMDIARARGIAIDAAGLSRRLGVPVVPVEGHRGRGMAELERSIARALRSPAGGRAAGAGAPPAACREPADVAGSDGPVSPPRPGAFPLDAGMEARLARLHDELAPAFEKARGRGLHSFEVLRAVVDRGGLAERRLSDALGAGCLERIEAVRRGAGGSTPLPALEARLRYAWVRQHLDGCVSRHGGPGVTWSERIDRVLTHRFLGLTIFAALMLLVFQSIFAWARPIMDAIDGAFAALGGGVEALLPEGALRSLLSDGVIAGVGMVVVFLPQILILFFFIGLLEDCGYMARAAFLMDKVMQKCGLSGKSFIPMLSGFACAVPGIMATRVIEDRRDRFATILVTPLMSCSARLPVYAIFIGTFIPRRDVIPGVLGLQAFTLFALYGLGITTAVAMAWLFRKTLLRGAKAPFVLELPSYKWPSVRGVLLRLYDRARAFLLRAGTTILAIAIVVWALAYFPRSPEIGAEIREERERILREAPEGAEMQALLAALEAREGGAYLRDSFFGRAGQAVEPVFRPLGWDWRISMAALASFPAREVIVATLGTIFGLGGEAGEESQALRDSLRRAAWPDSDPAMGGAPLFSVPAALSIMVFFALCCQCGATVATIRRETSSWGWAWFAFGYMTVLAYAGALVTYQVGMMF